MFGKSKVSQAMIDAVNSVIDVKVEQKSTAQPSDSLRVPMAPADTSVKTLSEASEKVATPTGMKVYGSSYGNSKKARQDQTKSSVDTLKGPKDKEVKEELVGGQKKIDANKNNKIDAQDFDILRGKKKVKEDMSFGNKLLEMIRKSDVPAYLRKAKGDTPLTVADVKAPKKDSISAPENLAKARNEEVELDEANNKKVPNLPIDNKGIDKHYGGSVVKMGAAAKASGFSDARIRKTGLDYLNRKEEAELDEGLGKNIAHGIGNVVKKVAPDWVAKQQADYTEKQRAAKQAAIDKFTNQVTKVKKEEVEDLDEAGQRRGMLGEPDLVNIPGPAKGTKPSPKAITKGSDREYYKSPGLGGTTVTKWRKKVAEGIELDEEQLDEMINEVLGKDASAGDWIHDFVHSDNPKFAGKSKAERKKMALGAYYGKQNETYQAADTAVTTDTLAGRMPGGKANSFKSYKLRVKPLDKEGEQMTKAPEVVQPVQTAARKSHEVKEATIAGTPGWEKVEKNVKDKSGAVHTPMSRAKDLARAAFKDIQSKTKVK